MSAETFEEKTDQLRSSTQTESSHHINVGDAIEVDSIKITPGNMCFENAYEGKHYEEKMVIQNCGSHRAFIRLLEPSSRTFQLKSFTKGIHLCPGMKIVRTVKYTYSRTLAIKQGFVTFFINGKEIDYHFTVTLSEAVVSVEPQLIKFGRIDAVNHAATRVFYIENSGYKGTQFSIDLGRNPLEMIVEPMKGRLPAKSSVKVSIEIVSSHEGEFAEEFWIKTNPPQRVVVTGTFISPKLLVRKFINSLDFTLMDFRPTYYGCTSTQSLLIRNFSSSHSMFCVMAEIKGTTMTLEEARKIDDNYKNFTVQPVDGRMAALRGSLIKLAFTPVKTEKQDKNYAACFLKVIRLDCRDVSSEDEICVSLKRTPQAQISSKHSFTSYYSSSKETLNLSENTSEKGVTSFEEDLAVDSFSFEHAIGVCLHGEKEKSAIDIKPTHLNLSELTLDKNYQRVLVITNKSTRLPVTVKYNKVPTIDIIPHQFELQPQQEKEVMITIRTYKLDRILKRITFDLLHIDRGGDKNLLKKVGTASIQVLSETTQVVKKPRYDQCVMCTEVLPKLSLEYPYRLTEAETSKKLRNDNFYRDYIRSLQKPPVVNTGLEDYPLTHTNLLNQTLKHEMPKPGSKIKRFTPFIPLAPRLLHNIKLTPKSIRLRKVAAFTTITDFFEIENLNTFPIRIVVRATKPCISFASQSRYIIDKKEKKQILFTFSTSRIGRYFVNIHVLVNDATLYEVTAVAHVVPKTLKVESQTLTFEEGDGDFKFFKIVNQLNAYTSFEWEVPGEFFQIIPRDGGIKAEKNMLCMVTHIPDPAQSNVSEFTLISESRQQQMVTVTAVKTPPLVVFDNYEVEFGAIPINVPIRKKIILRNLKSSQITFNIPSGVLIPGITIEPMRGTLGGFDSQVFVIQALIKAVIEFSTVITFYIDEEQDIEVNLKGVVEYPKICFIPDEINFRKIAPYSYDTLAFKIKNLSNSEVYITFAFEEGTEFSITDSEDEQFPHQNKVVLKPLQATVLFLHFHPNYIITHSLFLPYVINGIFGPVLINSGATTKPAHYIDDYMPQYIRSYKTRLVQMPRLLPIVRINGSATNKVLEFSSLFIDLKYFGEDHYNNVTSVDFEITNTSDEIATICIRTDELEPPFSLTPKDDVNIKIYRVSYVIIINPNEKSSFEVTFSPFELGTYKIKMPIFLNNYYNNRIFNFLTLKGIYKTPTIISSIKRCEFEPVPVKISNEIELTLYMSNHFEDCKVVFDCDLPGLCPNFENGNRPQTGNSVLQITLSYFGSKTSCFDTEMNFTCSCDAICTIPVSGIAENCLLTTHVFSHFLHPGQCDDGISRSLVFSDKSTFSAVRPRFFDHLMNTNTTCYPLFPDDNDESEYGIYMRNVKKTLENWIFSQIFYRKTYHRLPEGFSDFCKVSEPRKKLRFGGVEKATYVDIPLMQMMMNLAGHRIKDELGIRPLPDTDDPLEWLSYITSVNTAVLFYLRGFPVFVPNIKAKYLLNYEQYLNYHKIKHPNDQPMAEDIFYRRSQQCWVDLILQIIKTFFLFRTVNLLPTDDLTNNLSSTRINRKSVTQISRMSLDEGENNILEAGIYGEHEKELIAWLVNIYNDEKLTLWIDQDLPDDKEVVYLDEDLRDGLIFGAVTAHYCPYVKDEIRDMYTKPYNPEELLHNSCTLVKVWQILQFSYFISPLSILNGGMVELMLLTNYLYDILPNCLPREKIKIEAPLTKTNFAIVELENLGQDIIHYTIIFFGQDSHLFSTNNKVITVNPKSTKKVKIFYHAKTVKNATTHVLFSGETLGHKYGKSVAITFIGIADVSYACMEIPLNVDLYKPCEIVIETQSPFKVKANYSMYFGYQPVSKERTVLYAWDEIKALKTVKEFVLPDQMCEFDENGKSKTKITLCCQAEGPRNMWLYYTNPEVGDWGVQLTVTGRVTDACYENIDIILPNNYENFTCRCRRKIGVNFNCPLILHAKIPMKNNPLWNARKTMVLKYVSGEELNFWSTRIFTPVGTRILKLILDSETHPLRQQVTDTIEYEIEMNEPPPLVTFKRILITNIISEDCIDIPIHPAKNVNLTKLKKCVVRLNSTLNSAHCQLTRYYKFFFKSAADVADDSSQE